MFMRRWHRKILLMSFFIAKEKVHGQGSRYRFVNRSHPGYVRAGSGRRGFQERALLSRIVEWYKLG